MGIGYLKYGILEDFQNKEYSDLQNLDTVVDILKKYEENFESYQDKGLGFYIYGPNGTGKSHLANVLAKHLLEKNKSVYVFNSLYQLTNIIAKSWNDEEVEKVFDEIKNYDLVIIDEFGKLPTAKELAITEVFRFCKYRLTRHKPLILVSNLAPDEIKNIFGESFHSILKAFLVRLLINGPDYRNKIGSENLNYFGE